MTTLIILALGVVVGSGVFSGIEAALFAVPHSRVLVLKEEGTPAGLALAKLKSGIQRAIIVVVIGNNIVNIVGSIFVGVVAARTFENPNLGIVSALLTILIIIFGEILPKTIGENNAEKIGLVVARPLLFATRVLAPLIWLCERFTSRFTTIKKIVSEE